MTVTKREFFKMLGIGGAIVATSSAKLPADIGVCDLPTQEPEAPLLFAKYEYFTDAIDNIYYDSVCFRAGTRVRREFDLFSDCRGQTCRYTGVVKGAELTNMACMNQLPPPTSFWLKRIHIIVPEDTSDRDIRLARRFAWQFFGCDRIFAEGPVILDLQRRSLSDVLKGRVRAPRASMEFEHRRGLYLPSQYYFRQHFTSTSADLQVDPNGSGLTIVTALEGVQWRG